MKISIYAMILVTLCNGILFADYPGTEQSVDVTDQKEEQIEHNKLSKKIAALKIAYSSVLCFLEAITILGVFEKIPGVSKADQGSTVMISAISAVILMSMKEIVQNMNEGIAELRT